MWLGAACIRPARQAVNAFLRVSSARGPEKKGAGMTVIPAPWVCFRLRLRRDRLEREPEPELRRARRIRDVVVVDRLPVGGVVDRRRIGTVVLVVEQVEDLQHAVERAAAAAGEPLLKAGVHAM